MQLNQNLVTNELCSIFQSAYKVSHSTETALLRVTNDINLALNNHNDVVVLLMLDLSSAFDTIDHNILIDRLQSRNGITGTGLEWITSYLTNRSQSTVINHCQSTPSGVRHPSRIRSGFFVTHRVDFSWLDADAISFRTTTSKKTTKKP